MRPGKAPPTDAAKSCSPQAPLSVETSEKCGGAQSEGELEGGEEGRAARRKGKGFPCSKLPSRPILSCQQALKRQHRRGMRFSQRHTARSWFLNLDPASSPLFHSRDPKAMRPAS